MNKKIISSYCMLPVVAALLLMACEKSETFPDRDDPAAGKARIRFYNASPNAKPVSIFVNGQRINAATGTGYYAAFPGEYFVVNPGQGTIKVTDTASTNPVQYFETSQPLEANKHYSLFAVDSFAKVKALFIEDKITQPDTARGHIRFLNLIPNSAGADIMVTRYNGVTLAVPDTLVKALPFQGLADFRPIRFGSYDFKINTKTATGPLVSTNVTAVSIAEGGQYTFVARGFVGGTGTGALAGTVSGYRPTY